MTAAAAWRIAAYWTLCLSHYGTNITNPNTEPIRFAQSTIDYVASVPLSPTQCAATISSVTTINTINAINTTNFRGMSELLVLV